MLANEPISANLAKELNKPAHPFHVVRVVRVLAGADADVEKGVAEAFEEANGFIGQTAEGADGAFAHKGIGLARTEHMFFGKERINIVRKMIMAEGESEREAYLRRNGYLYA